jgi:hypothetical protein
MGKEPSKRADGKKRSVPGLGNRSTLNPSEERALVDSGQELAASFTMGTLGVYIERSMLRVEALRLFFPADTRYLL